MSELANATVMEHDDGKFVRTAIVIPEEGESFALVDEEGNRLCLINAFIYPDKRNRIIVDVIDVDENYDFKHAAMFYDGRKQFHEVPYLVCADFGMKDKWDD